MRTTTRSDRAVVRRYLVMLETGEVADAEQAHARLTKKIERCGDVLERLGLVQARLDAQRCAEAELEAAFVSVAGAWGAARGVTWEAWRAVGVSSAVLERAGITPVPAPSRR